MSARECADCDFAALADDGQLICVMSDSYVHGSDSCDDWQAETHLIDGDEWYEVMAWPAQRRTRSS